MSHFCQPVRDTRGAFLGRRASNRDITDRKEAERRLQQLTSELERANRELTAANERLRDEIRTRRGAEAALSASEERYRRMVGAVTGYTYSVHVGPSGATSTRHSPGCTQVTGYDPGDYLADPYLWFSMIHPDDRDAVERAVRETLAGDRAAPVEHRLLRRDGRTVWVRNTIVPFRDEAGRLCRYDGLIEDITERRLAELKVQDLNRELARRIEELTRANDDLDAFNYTVSHDLQTPLVVIGGFARRLFKSCRGKLDEREAGMLATIQASGLRMEDLVRDLLLFSRSGRHQPEASWFDMRELFLQAAGELRGTLGARAVSFEAPPLPPAFGDRALIRQVVVNLLSNALKFTRGRERAVIGLSGRRDGPETVFAMRDNGVGFPPEAAAAMFAPFHRLHPPKYEGTGIGLSIVKRIVERHGGRVWGEGRPGEGAVFSFSLPNGP